MIRKMVWKNESDSLKTLTALFMFSLALISLTMLYFHFLMNSMGTKCPLSQNSFMLHNLTLQLCAIRHPPDTLSCFADLLILCLSCFKLWNKSL